MLPSLNKGFVVVVVVIGECRQTIFFHILLLRVITCGATIWRITSQLIKWNTVTTVITGSRTLVTTRMIQGKDIQ